jgi:predicted ABC-type ATPase
MKCRIHDQDDLRGDRQRASERGSRGAPGAWDGGHSAPVERIVEIYQRSLANLTRALAVFDEVALYDNSVHDKPPRLVRVYDEQRISFDEPPVPPWLEAVMAGG